ncbi:unnamed protein product [Nezara viridula]|uniref:Uncharacterized protein n=1 Tax=Nezara viridula TaxID=85310 RepID=A0A9P0MYM4_NEZVI|nr:unnamed protein product [Nezara viridula]
MRSNVQCFKVNHRISCLLFLYVSCEYQDMTRYAIMHCLGCYSSSCHLIATPSLIVL